MAPNFPHSKAIKIPTKHTETTSTMCQVVRNCIKCNLMSLESVLSNGKHCRYYFGPIAYNEFSGKSSKQRYNRREFLSCMNFYKRLLTRLSERTAMCHQAQAPQFKMAKKKMIFCYIFERGIRCLGLSVRVSKKVFCISMKISIKFHENNAVTVLG